MKKIQITPQSVQPLPDAPTMLTVGGPGPGINTPIPIGPVEVTHFPESDDVSEPIHMEPGERLPGVDPVFQPGPAAAVPPRAAVPPPEPTFEGYMAAALAARGSSMPFAHFWAMMAQNLAVAELAEQLAVFNDFVGANDGPEDAQLRLYEVIAAGIQEAETEGQKPEKKEKKK